MPRLARAATLAAALVAAGLAVLTAGPAAAFSQIGTRDGAAPQREGIVSVPLPPLSGTGDPADPSGTATTPGAAQGTPATPPATPPSPPETATPPAGAKPAEGAAPPPTAPALPDDATDEGETEDPAIDIGPAPEDGTRAAPGPQAGGEDVPAPPVAYGDDGLPKPVKDLRDRLIAIARAGDIEALRPYVAIGDEGTVLSFGEQDGDPIAFLKAALGDGEGVEILAIILEVLESGHVRQDPGTDEEIFVWPYFTAVAIDKLTRPQKVELFELVTAGDYQEMLGFGAYNFYRVGISPDGKLQFFVAGD